MLRWRQPDESRPHRCVMLQVTTATRFFLVIPLDLGHLAGNVSGSHFEYAPFQIANLIHDLKRQAHARREVITCAQYLMYPKKLLKCFSQNQGFDLACDQQSAMSAERRAILL